MGTTAVTRPPPPSLPGHLVATKLHVPEVRPGSVPRAELVRRLAAADGCKLTLVCAPAGWGKTVLLAQWRASPAEERPFAWVSLDPNDDDPVRFWAYVIAALRTVEPELGVQALAALPSAGPALLDAVVAPLITELDALPGQLVLVLDDYHLLRNEQIHASMAFLLRHLPRGLHLALAGRADPPLPLASLRAAGELTEIRAAELRFSDADADALLNDSLGLGLERPEVELLQARTEGWAAGLQLAALSLRTQKDRQAFLKAFAGDDRQIGEYLNEVLDGQPARLREFLLRTSILDRMCADLCDAVVGKGDAAEQLAAAERSNLFLVPLDARREWYRYHHLFSDLIRHELDRTDPAVVPELHRRAAAWHREKGEVEDAIAHATAAGDFADAGELIARHWRPTFALGQRERVAAWIDALPREAVLADSRLCLARGWTSLFLGHHAEGEWWARAAEAGSLPGPLPDWPSVEAAAALLRGTCAYFAGDVGAAIEHGRRAIALDPDETSPSRPVSRLVLALPLYFAGELEEAGALLEKGSSRPPDPGWADAVVNVYSRLASVRFAAGDSARAEGAAAEAERLVAELGLDEMPSVTCVKMARAQLLDQRGDTAGAEAALIRAVELARRGTRWLELAHALLLLAQLKRRRRDHVAARELAREARAVLDTCPDPGTLRELLDRTERSLQLAAVPASAPVLPADVELSEREVTILRLLASQLSQREIGAQLFISVNTVKGHVRSIFRKLGVADRAAAVARGRELGLI